MTKDQAINHIKTKPTWGQTQIIETIYQLELKAAAKYIPSKLQVGDIFFHIGLDHPVMVLTDKLGVLTTTTASNSNLCEIKSRFISGWITTTLVQIDPEISLRNFICLHDDRLQVYRIKKLLKKQLQSFVETL